jgi:hypothetical protein
MGVDAEWDARTQLVQAWMLADGKTATAQRMFAAMPRVSGSGLATESTLADGSLAEAAPVQQAEALWRRPPCGTPGAGGSPAGRSPGRRGRAEYAAYLRVGPHEVTDR